MMQPIVTTDGPFDHEQPGERGSIELHHLPPMPIPHYEEKRGEAMCGCFTVLLLTGGLVAITHSIVFDGLQPKPFKNNARAIMYGLIWSEAIVALLCLLGLLLDDPGTIKRSAENCFPLPPEVEEKLLTGQPLTGLRNVIVDGRSFCVRCCVWRESAGLSRFDGVSNTHHCDTCQRCVRDFDHHCGVFGRCIAGEGMGGNMKYFKTIIAMLAVGILTCIATVIVQAL